METVGCAWNTRRAKKEAVYKTMLLIGIEKYANDKET